MKIRQISLLVAGCAALLAAPVGAATFESGSDAAFNRMVETLMVGHADTGSGWLNYYVERLNQDIALQQGTEPYGAAGPNGPLSGFEGYISGFRMPDTGSRWFNDYVEVINHVIQEKQDP